MALDAGVMAITIEFAKDLKDSDWFGKQDPYCIVRCGGQQFRTRTAVDGGKNPVWNETFSFNVINENTVDLEIKDEDVGRDDTIGLVSFTLAKARESGSDRIQAPVVSKKSKKQHGFVSIALKWTPNNAMKAAPAAAPPMYMAAPPGAPGAYYAAPPPMPMYPGAPAPVAYYAAPPPYGMPMQPAGYPPAGAPPPAHK